MPPSKIRSWDDYFIPGTTVLRNKYTAPDKPYGQTDPQILQRLETMEAAQRLSELDENPIKGSFDYAHMKKIHHYIFQDVYEWAGQERVAPVGEWMTKSGPDVINYPPGDPEAKTVAYSYYPAGPVLTAAAEAQYAKIARLDYLQGMGRKEFVKEFAEIWGELNVVHSFREGNTRAQFVFFSQLAEQAGYTLNTDLYAESQALRQEFIAARFYSQATGSNARLADVLDKSLE